MDDLPNQFDVIVTGTGLTQSIISAACSRIGKTVLHCDENDMYGQEWQSMNWDTLIQWIQKNTRDNDARDNNTRVNDTRVNDDDGDDYNEQLINIILENNERLMQCHRNKTIDNISTISYMCEDIECHDNSRVYDGSSVYVNDSSAAADSSSAITDGTSMIADTSVSTDGNDLTSANDSSPSIDGTSMAVDTSSAAVYYGAVSVDGDNDNQWTLKKFHNESRKFNFDLCPRLLYACGSMVNLLVSSNISRYAEFKAVNRILAPIDGKLMDVPCTKYEVFNCKDVSIIEKRMLMKFIEFCMEFSQFYEFTRDKRNITILKYLIKQNLPPVMETFISNAIIEMNDNNETQQQFNENISINEYLGSQNLSHSLQKFITNAIANNNISIITALKSINENLPVIGFLKTQNITPLLQKLILNSIAMVNNDSSLNTALKSIWLFINSSGKFGITPYLYTLYGSGELPQAFCRLCAVFGGIYTLKRQFTHIILNNLNECTSVIIDGKRINCNFLVTDTGIVRDVPKRECVISRAILISDTSIKSSDNEKLSFFRFPITNDLKTAVYGIESGRSALISPKGLYIVYLWCDSVTGNAKQDLMSIVKRLYNFTPEESIDRPKLLWVMYFNQISYIYSESDDFPSRVYVTTGPINEIDYDFAINEARTIFHKMYPNEEFLPRAPDPNEIVFDTPPENNDIEMHEQNSNNNDNDNNNVPNVNSDTNELPLLNW